MTVHVVEGEIIVVAVGTTRPQTTWSRETGKAPGSHCLASVCTLETGKAECRLQNLNFSKYLKAQKFFEIKGKMKCWEIC